MVQVDMSYNRRHNAAKPDDLHSVEVTRHYRALPGLRRRNAAERDADHPIEVTKHYRSGPPGYLSPWQRAAEMRSKRNPGVTKAAYRSGLKEASAAQLGKLARIGLRTGHTVTDIKADLKATGRFTAEQIARGIEQAREAEKRQNPPEFPRGWKPVAEQKKEFKRELKKHAQKANKLYALALEYYADFGEPGAKDAAQIYIEDDLRRNIGSLRGDAFSDGLDYEIQLLTKMLENKKNDPRHGYTRSNPRRGTRRYMGSASLTASARAFESPRVLLLQDLIEAGEATPREISEYHRLIDQFNRRAFDVVETRHAKRGNPGKGKEKTRRLYETFSGKRARRENSVTAPTGTPANVAKLGTLRLIETADGRKWKFRGAGAPILAADHRHKLHVVGGSYRMNPTGAECGEIVRVEYETDKPHLGQTTPAIYFHELGEETGERPTLRIDGDGLMHIDGGAYSIEADGIHN